MAEEKAPSQGIRNNDPRETPPAPNDLTEKWKEATARGINLRTHDDERTKVYDNPENDPAIQELRKKAIRISPKDNSVKAEPVDWNAFAKVYPEKASAYESKIKGIAYANT